jgi:DNA uptake protein ComE-like DNA-binding protein
LGVKIVEYRNAHNMHITIEEKKKVDRIGQGIFNAIQHYMSVD